MIDRRGPDLDKLSEADLRALGERIEVELERRLRERQHGERACGGLLEGQGPRYRNPENPSETWSGRGPQPAWVSDLRARGTRLDSLRIPEERRAPGIQGRYRD